MRRPKKVKVGRLNNALIFNICDLLRSLYKFSFFSFWVVSKKYRQFYRYVSKNTCSFTDIQKSYRYCEYLRISYILYSI